MKTLEELQTDLATSIKDASNHLKSMLGKTIGIRADETVSTAEALTGLCSANGYVLLMQWVVFGS